MYKKILALALVGVMTAGLCACGANNTKATETADSSSGPVKAVTDAETEAEEETEEAEVDETADVTDETDEALGGWSTYPSETALFDEETQSIFDTAAESWDGGDLRPIALLATQVVAGTNYCFLVENTIGETIYELVFVYNDLENNSTITNVIPIDVTAESFGESDAEMLEGGWTVQKTTYANPGRDLIDICDSAAEDEYYLLAPLATQVVSGTNYMMLCETEVQNEDAMPQLAILTVYHDLEENNSIIEVKPFNIPYLIDQAAAEVESEDVDTDYEVETEPTELEESAED